LALVTDGLSRGPAPSSDRLDVQVSFAVSTVDAVTVRKGLTAVTKPSREVAWRGPTRFAARIHETLAELHELVRARHPACVSLSEHAMLCVDKALGQFSDADPDMDALREEVRGLHRDACQAVPPKPVALAPRLVELAEKTEHDWLQDAPERYRDLLGDEGLAALDTILTRKLDAMPPDSRAALSHTGLALRAMSESLARALGDIDRLVSELARDLTSPARYVRIAQELDTARRRDDALDWLQRGVAEYGAGDDALREALVIAYLQADRRADAVAMLRIELQRVPSALLTAELLGAAGEERDAERTWAHALLADAAERDGDGGELVTALLADGATAAALGAATKLPVPVTVRLELARIAAVDDLDAALEHYRLLVTAELETSDRESYGNAIRHLRAMRKAAEPHGRGGEVIAFARALREEHTRRRTLVTMLDKLGWW
jgi:tetratricopeptide (TPR) repeat protein